jgi:Putative MetA-pathway of phenol degradation
MTKPFRFEYGRSKILRAAVVAACCIAAVPAAQAQITRGFIGSREYQLPDPKGMKPWNVYVEYSTLQNTTKAWNSNADKVSAGKVESLVSLSKFVHFWEAFPGVGIAMELIVPKVSVRDKAGNGAGDVAGIADPIVGPAWWIKPSPNWTLGSDFFFVQIPVGERELSNRAWNVIASVFWDGQFDKLNWTGNIGTTLPGKSSSGARGARSIYVNNRLGYKVSDFIEPYIGIDYERGEAKGGNPGNHEWGAAFGAMLYTHEKGHTSIHYERGIRGENRGMSNNLNLRFAYVF